MTEYKKLSKISNLLNKLNNFKTNLLEYYEKEGERLSIDCAECSENWEDADKLDKTKLVIDRNLTSIEKQIKKL